MSNLEMPAQPVFVLGSEDHIYRRSMTEVLMRNIPDATHTLQMLETGTREELFSLLSISPALVIVHGNLLRGKNDKRQLMQKKNPRTLVAFDWGGEGGTGAHTTPQGAYFTMLPRHLRELRDHVLLRKAILTECTEAGKPMEAGTMHPLSVSRRIYRAVRSVFLPDEDDACSQRAADRQVPLPYDQFSMHRFL